MTPEAIALHYLDNLDAKLHTFTREIRDDPAATRAGRRSSRTWAGACSKGSTPDDGSAATADPISNGG